MEAVRRVDDEPLPVPREPAHRAVVGDHGQAVEPFEVATADDPGPGGDRLDKRPFTGTHSHVAHLPVVGDNTRRAEYDSGRRAGGCGRSGQDRRPGDEQCENERALHLLLLRDLLDTPLGAERIHGVAGPSTPAQTQTAKSSPAGWPLASSLLTPGSCWAVFERSIRPSPAVSSARTSTSESG